MASFLGLGNPEGFLQALAGLQRPKSDLPAPVQNCTVGAEEIHSPALYTSVRRGGIQTAIERAAVGQHRKVLPVAS